VREGKVGEISHFFCPVSSKYQPIPAVKSSARCWGQPRHSPPATTSAQRASAGAALISHRNPSWKRQYLTPSYPEGCSPRATALGYQGRYLRVTPGPVSRLLSPALGAAWVGGCWTTGAEQLPWCFSASVINH